MDGPPLIIWSGLEDILRLLPCRSQGTGGTLQRHDAPMAQTNKKTSTAREDDSPSPRAERPDPDRLYNLYKMFIQPRPGNPHPNMEGTKAHRKRTCCRAVVNRCTRRWEHVGRTVSRHGEAARHRCRTLGLKSVYNIGGKMFPVKGPAVGFCCRAPCLVQCV
jgi:hypothetical protein